MVEEVIRVIAQLDINGATYITKLLYSEVAKGNLKFELKSKVGSVYTYFIITILQEVGDRIRDNFSISDLLVMGTTGIYLIKKIHRWLKRERENGRHYKPVKIKTLTKEVIITGDEENIKEIKIKEIKEEYQGVQEE